MVHIWDVATNVHVHTFRGHRGTVSVSWLLDPIPRYPSFYHSFIAAGSSELDHSFIAAGSSELDHSFIAAGSSELDHSCYLIAIICQSLGSGFPERHP